MQKYLPAAMPLMAPYVNSYSRLLAGEGSAQPIWLGAWITGQSGLRVPRSRPDNRRIENRIPGADANPYLAIAASLAAVYLGIHHEIRARRELTKSGLEDVTTIPRNLDVALDNLMKGHGSAYVLGEEFCSNL